VEFDIFAECVTAMLIVKRIPEVHPKMYICENWKSTNQTAIRGLMPHEIFSLYGVDAVSF
jgi:hypothetical protein